jgi:phospholipid/cholesterol/gamma-HCH transport system substrate-binding protein
MRRILAISVLTVSAAVLFVFGGAAGGEDGTYEVRAIFDSAGFLVPGEEVRVAGAKVGTVAELDVTGEDEAAHEDGSANPGKAVVVLRIEDPGFQDFRTDASCLIRPQSLIGEKFVECEPTQPRAPGTEPPPELAEIADGETGEGERLLPLENNGKAVDLDLLNDIMEEPYPDRFRLILNDLGAGLAARGEELAEIVERSNPALRETNRVLAILARQNRALAGLATDSDAILSALARERESVVGFINEATTVGEATAERSAELEETFARFPGFLRELRSTMVELGAFSDQATPVFSDLDVAAPSLTRASQLLEPFSNAGTGALTSLGDAAEEAGPPLIQSDPVIRQIRGIADAGEPATRNLAQTLSTLRRTDGFRHLMETLFGISGSVNAFDSFGHFLRALIPVNNCFDYTSIEQAGCSAKFVHTSARATARTAARVALRALRRANRPEADRAEPERRRGAAAAPESGLAPVSPAVPGDPSEGLEAPAEPGADTGNLPPASGTTPAEPSEPGAQAGAPSAGDATRGTASMRATKDLLDFLIGERGGRRGSAK